MNSHILMKQHIEGAAKCIYKKGRVKNEACGKLRILACSGRGHSQLHCVNYTSHPFCCCWVFFYVFSKNEKETYELQPTNLGIGLGKASCLLGVAVTVDMERHELVLVVPFQ